MMLMELEYSERIHAILSQKRIFQKRTGLGAGKAITPQDRIKIGTKIFVRADARLEAYCTIDAGKNLFTTGAFSSITSAFPPDARIGRYCSVAPGLQIQGFRHPISAVSQSSAVFNLRREFINSYIEDKTASGELSVIPKSIANPQPQGMIEIGHDVWIGANCTIPSSVKIGNGAIVASNSHVTKDVAPYAIVGGNPARVIRYRFEQHTIDNIERTSWWNFELASIFNQGLNFADPKGFIAGFDHKHDQLKRANYDVVMGIDLVTDERPILLNHHGAAVVTMSGNFQAVKLQDLTKEHTFPLPFFEEHYEVDYHSDGRVSVRLENGFLSSQPNGHFTEKPKASDWEKFYIFS